MVLKSAETQSHIICTRVVLVEMRSYVTAALKRTFNSAVAGNPICATFIAVWLYFYLFHYMSSVWGAVSKFLCYTRPIGAAGSKRCRRSVQKMLRNGKPFNISRLNWPICTPISADCGYKRFRYYTRDESCKWVFTICTGRRVKCLKL